MVFLWTEEETFCVKFFEFIQDNIPVIGAVVLFALIR
jgi:hypothetical protein